MEPKPEYLDNVLLIVKSAIKTSMDKFWCLVDPEIKTFLLKSDHKIQNITLKVRRTIDYFKKGAYTEVNY